MPAPKTPSESKPQLYVVPKLEAPAAPRPKPAGHHKRKLRMPPLPQALLDSMTELEQEWFYFYMDAYQADYPGMKPTDLLCLQQAAIEHINNLRTQTKQLDTGEVISMARQHPGVQERAWLDMMDCTRKARSKGKQSEDSDEAKELKEALKAMSTAG